MLLRILPDEQLPRRLAPHLAGHDARTVQQETWAGLNNGALLDRLGSSTGGTTQGHARPKHHAMPLLTRIVTMVTILVIHEFEVLL